MEKKKQKKWYRYLIQLMVVALIVTSIPLNGLAEEVPPFTPSPNSEENPPTEEMEELPAPHPDQLKKKAGDSQLKPTEVVEKRTETEKVFDNQDGTFTRKIYMEPIHTEKDGKLEEVSTTLVEGPEQKVVTKNTTLKTEFAKTVNGNPYAQFQAGNHSIQYQLLSAKGENGEVKTLPVSASYDQNTVSYKGIFPKIDLVSKTFNGIVKEDLVLHEYTGDHTFTFSLQTELTPSLQEDGSIHFQNNKQEKVFVLPKPFMNDSHVDEKSGEATTSEEVTYSIEKSGEHTYVVTVTADPKWLQAPERKYPVHIDPSIKLGDFDNAYGSSAYPSVNYSGGKLWDPGQNAYTLKVGYYDQASGRNYSYIKPDTSELKGAKIESATFHAYAVWHFYGNQPNGVWLDEVTGAWNEGSLNWNNKPGSNNIAHTNVGRGKWAQFNVTNTVKAWAEGTKPNHGFKLHTNGNGQNHWKKFIAAENGTNAPFLEVKYSYGKPNTPRVQAYSNGSGSGSGHLNIQWDAVPGATGYQVAIFNGYDYEYIPVGNVTSWTTKDKKIFPTPEEIAQGEFEFHEVGKGAEAPVNPGPIYKNAFLAGSPYGDYSGRSNYWIRIVAEYPFGDSPLSDESRPFIPLEQVKKPDGSAYINATDKQTGYVTLKWDPVPAASGYKVWMYNGKDYEAFDVGNKTNWTTQNEKIWPTKEEITQKRYLLHHDKKGTELAIDPSPVYRNSGGIYGESTNYWFRVTAYSTVGHAESSISQEFTPKFSQDFGFMGMFDYWASIPVLNGQVNATNGNFLMEEKDITLSGRGPDVSVERTYNSQSTQVGLFGKGWYSSLEEKIRRDAGNNLILLSANGADITFTRTGEGTYQAPTGVYLEIKETTQGYEIKDKDQTVTTYSKTGNTGRIESIKDKYGNTTTYSYDGESRLAKVKNASGKELVVQYDGNNKKAARVIGPDNKTLTFNYDGDVLVSSTTPEGKVYKYGYDNGVLTAIYDPQHTDAKPYKTSYAYENNRLVKVTDPLGKATTLAYNPGAKEVTLTNPKGRKTVYTYNDAGNPVKTVEDVGRLNLTTTYEYNANNLVKTTTPKNQTETMTYDNNGNVTSVTDEMGTEKFVYNKDNGIIKETDNEGRESTVAYKAANTEVSETDQAAHTSSVIFHDKYGNPIETSKELGTGENLIQNPSFEMNGTEKWVKVDTNNTGSIAKDATPAPGGLGGESSLKITTKATNNDWGYIAAIQEVALEPNTTYTLSGMIKTALPQGSAFFNVQLLQENGAAIDGGGWYDTRHNKVQGERDWINRQVTFKTTEQTRKVKIYLQVENGGSSTDGSVWFDKMQLEKGEVSSSFNPIENSSLENIAGNGCMPGWIRGDGTSCDAKDISHNESFTGHSSLVLERSQYGGSNVGYGKHVNVNQKKAEPLTLTGMSKSENVENDAPDKLSRDYSIWADVYYQDGSGTNYQAKFPSGTNDWNRSAVVIPATKPIKRMEIYLLFRHNNKGKVWFDDVRLLEGNALIKNEYDNDGNVVATYDEEGQKNSFTYDASGNKKSETDEKGNTKLYDYNRDNLLTKVTLKNGTSVNYRYDHNGNTTEKSVMFGGKTQTHKYEYDVDNKNTVYIDALNRRIEHTYDENANKIKTKMPNGSILESVYDTADRVIGEKRNGKDSFTFERDPNGQVTKVKDLVNGVERTKTYDKTDRVTSATDSRGGKVDWAYHDKANSKTEKLKEQTVTQGGYTNKVSYDYNTLDQNIRVTDGSQTYRFDYDDQGNVRTYTAGNGSGSTFNYDHANKIKDLVVGTSNSILLSERYEYDQAGNRTVVKHESPTTGRVTQTTYEYDANNQLTKEIFPALGGSKTYTYDGFGNRTSVTTTKIRKKTTIEAQFNDGNQLVKFGNESLTYDANGNRTSDGKYKYTWNEDDQLISVTKQGATTPFATYKYDEDNRRIEKNVEGNVTRYFYDGDSINPLYETDGSGKVLRQYVYSVDGLRLAMKSNGQTVYYHYNPRGDVIAMTDQNREVVATYEYDAWGNVLKSDAKGIAADNPFGYAGYMYDKEIGMYYLIARYYQPDHGVFLSVDPDPGDEDDPITMNGYTYADNNPVMNIDPDGHLAWFAPLAIHGARMAAPHVGRFVGKQLAKRAVKKPMQYKGKIGAPKRKVVFDQRKLPTKGAKKNSVTYHFKKGKLDQKRYYDHKGRVRKDIDYTNHKNPKQHPVVPHQHYWKWKNGKPQHTAWYPLRKKW